MKYIKLFRNLTNYEDYIEGEKGEIFLPNVSYCRDMDSVLYNPYVIPLNQFSGVINVLNTTLSYRLFSGATVIDNIKVMKIDGVEVEPVSAITFSSDGEHTYNVEFKEPLSTTNNLFNSCSGLTLLDVSNLDTSNSINMQSMFLKCTGITSLDLSKWDVSNVTNMAYMFSGCTSLSSVIDLSNWDISNVTTMNGMFRGCNQLTDIRMGGDPKNVSVVSNMFGNITTNGKFYYNPLYNYDKIISVLPSTWEAIPLYSNMECTELRITTPNDVSGNATKVLVHYVATLTGNSTTDGSVVTLKVRGDAVSSEFEQNTSETDERQINVSFTYYGLTETVTITQKPYNYNMGLGDYRVDSNVQTILLFNGNSDSICELFINGEEILPVQSSYRFNEAGRYNINLRLKDNVTDLNKLFDSAIIYYLDLNKWDVSKVTNMYGMFSSCGHLISLEISNWDTGKVTDMSYMFSNCGSLTSLDLSNWDTSSVTNMKSMFHWCQSLTSLDLSNCVFSKVTNMEGMFSGCTNLTEIKSTNMVLPSNGTFNELGRVRVYSKKEDIETWNVSNVTDMTYMLYYCSGLTSLDLSNWDTSNVTNMDSMFGGCYSLTEIKMGGDVSNVSNVTNMFDGAASNGTFYYNSLYNYSNIIAQLPEGWTTIPCTLVDGELVPNN